MDTKSLCLGVLTAGDMTGYELKKTFEDCFRHFFLAGFGSIYPALADLEKRGLVVCRAVEQEKRPDKKVYRITEAGHDALVDELSAEPPRHRVRSEFLALMYFAHLLPPERLEAVVDDMIAQFEHLMWDDLDRLDEDEQELTPGQRFALGYGRTVLTAALAYMKRQKDQLLRDARAAANTTEPEPGETRRDDASIVTDRVPPMAAAGD